MTPFLYRIASTFYQQYGDDLYRLTFVFPNRRAGVFFQKYLAEVAEKPLFSPTIITISELFESLSNYRLADRIEMLVMLYGHYQRISESVESFDEFLFWGEMLLNDFSDADKHLADAYQLFRNVQDLKSMDLDMSYLSKSQIEAIRRFWTNFMPIEGNDTKKEFLELWRILFDLYTSFREELMQKGLAYEGMLFREVAERAKTKKELPLPFSEIVFMGFNALTPAESALMTHFHNLKIADFYWDYASPLVRDKQNKASLWAQENLTRFPSRFEIEEENSSEEKPIIEVVGIPSGVGQAKQVRQILSQLVENKSIPNPNEAINTAIVLPDENLLLPVLYSIPSEIGKINVTMGYGLSHASIAGLIEHLSDLQRNLRMANGETVFYFRFVLAVLNHPLIALAARNEAEALKKHIAENNRISVSEKEIGEYPLLAPFFRPVENWKEISEYLKSILSFVYRQLPEKKVEEEDGDPTNEVHPMDLEREFIVQYYKSVTRLEDMLQGASIDLSTETYFRLLKQLSRSISVPFSGEPLSGLQVMGVLETRVLDFENLILLSMNEGVFPVRRALNSFIPYSLRKAFGLPVHEHQDGTYAYHFYRMISRAKRVFMLYDTRSEEMQTGEVSRYFYQLKYLYNDWFDIREHVVSYDVSAPETYPVSVSKTPEIIRKLSAFREGGEKYLSASSINNYINCPLQFYFTAVEGFDKEEDEVQESVEASVFGTIFHRLMEKLYGRYRNKTVTPDVLNELIADDNGLTLLLEEAFAEHYFKRKNNPEPLKGQYYLIGEILRDYVKRTLKTDIRFTPFEYIGSEYRFKETYRVNDKLSVNFKGSIDRIDSQDGAHRIIDYKTGTGSVDFKSMEQLFDASKNKRPYQILQVFIYALFYAKEKPETKLSPAIYYLRSIFNDKFDPSVTFNNEPIKDISLSFDEFSEHFNRCLEEIFDGEIPFRQAENEKSCEWCAFKIVCGR